jgi:hypothetical protein
VLITSSVLLFLGDSPMHAEITNTPLPNNALNPCRMCRLAAPTQQSKQSKKYLHDFLQIDGDGNQKLNPSRQWNTTIEATYDLFDIGYYSTLKEHKHMGKIYGVKDRTNEKFIENKKNRAVALRVAKLLKEDLKQLFNPFLKLKGVILFIISRVTLTCFLTGLL